MDHIQLIQSWSLCLRWSHLLHLVVELFRVGVPLLPLPVEALQQVGPLAAPPLLSVLQFPAEVQRGAVTLSQKTQMLLALLIQAPLGISLRVAPRLATRLQLAKEQQHIHFWSISINVKSVNGTVAPLPPPPPANPMLTHVMCCNVLGPFLKHTTTPSGFPSKALAPVM